MTFLALTDFSQALSQGASHAWLFIPTAVLLGALHGLEPGHSKTMMAAFIIAIRGTVWQATLLGLSAAISHSLLIWLLAAAALKYGGQWNAETTEPYFQIASAVIIAGLAVWMFWRTRRDTQAAAAHEHQDHNHNPGHSHGHDDTKLIKTGHGTVINLSVFETGRPPVFRLAFLEHGKSFLPEPSSVII
jgi:nickel/cobalt transporter (NicO) family protein